MYVPAHFATSDADGLLTRLAGARLSILITPTEEGGLWATHLPMLWNAETRTLDGHIARANPHPKLAPNPRALVITPGPEAYVSPSLYASKAETHRVVPTWNYEAVHVSGALTWFEEPARLKDMLRRLTERHEAPRAEPWSIDDAPEDYVNALLRGIVGVAVSAEHIEAKRKLSQNKSAADIAGVIDGLVDDAPEIAALMRDES
ncbi:MAG: FMN-binding negative transcriptional regulator [Pseudomonadota bacterium]